MIALLLVSVWCSSFQDPASFVYDQWATEAWRTPDPHASLSRSNARLAQELKKPHKPGELTELATSRFRKWDRSSRNLDQLLPLTLSVALALELDPTAEGNTEFDRVRAVVYKTWSVVRDHRSREVARVGYLLWQGSGFRGSLELGHRLLAETPNDEDVQYAFIEGTTSTARKLEELDHAVQLADRLARTQPTSLRAQLAKHKAHTARFARTKEPSDRLAATLALRTAVKLLPSDYPESERKRLVHRLNERGG